MTPASNIFLSGFMGCGKTTLGKKLAALLQINFFDLDNCIEQIAQKKIDFIFSQQGEIVFREIESDALKKIVDAPAPNVIALGGGTVCFADNLQVIKNNGLLIYIMLPAKTLVQRLLQHRAQRPLLKHLNDADLIQFVEETLKNREVYYRQAHLVVDGSTLTAQTLHQKILEFKA
jgi:shikimate kinase